MNKWKISTIVLALLVVALGVLLGKGYLDKKSPTAAANKAVDYINKYLSSSNATLAGTNKGTYTFYKFNINIGGQEYPSFISTDGKLLIPYDSIDITGTAANSSVSNKPEMAAKESTQVEGSFNSINDADVCTEDGKPIVYFFESSTCPHCLWEKPVLEKVVNEFGSAVSFHESIDLDKDSDVFSKYSSGPVPTLVVGCKYWRIGSGESQGEEAEKASLTKVICRATGNQPASLCGE